MKAIQNKPWDHTRSGSVRRAGDAHRLTAELLLQFGIMPHLCGYELLCDGIRIRAERRYAVGRTPENGMPPRETALRGAIDAGFLHTDAIHAQFFPCADRPGNSEFICTLAMLVRDRLTASARPD
jgi:hypothetical protein